MSVGTLHIASWVVGFVCGVLLVLAVFGALEFVGRRRAFQPGTMLTMNHVRTWDGNLGSLVAVSASGESCSLGPGSSVVFLGAAPLGRVMLRLASARGCYNAPPVGTVLFADKTALRSRADVVGAADDLAARAEVYGGQP